jgi:hypothetical protein
MSDFHADVSSLGRFVVLARGWRGSDEFVVGVFFATFVVFIDGHFAIPKSKVVRFWL